MTAFLAAAVGFASLAAAMGIGRFAFTPLLPLMQQAQGLTLAQGAWLATANYLGYLVGACACFVRSPAPGAAARWGLAFVALTTAPMAFTTAFGAWFALRFARAWPARSCSSARPPGRCRTSPRPGEAGSRAACSRASAPASWWRGRPA